MNTDSSYKYQYEQLLHDVDTRNEEIRILKKVISKMEDNRQKTSRRIKWLENAIKYALEMDAREGYIMHPDAVQNMINAVKSEEMLLRDPYYSTEEKKWMT